MQCLPELSNEHLVKDSQENKSFLPMHFKCKFFSSDIRWCYNIALVIKQREALYEFDYWCVQFLTGIMSQDYYFFGTALNTFLDSPSV